MHRKIKKSFRFTKAASHSISRTPPRGCAGIRFGRCQLALTRIPRQFSRARIELSACLISHADSFLFRNSRLYFGQTASYSTAPALYSVFFKIDPAVKDLYTVLAKPLGLRPRAAERKLP